MLTNSMSYRSVHSNKRISGSSRRSERGVSAKPSRLLTLRVFSVVFVFCLLFSGFAIVQSHANSNQPDTLAEGERTIVVSSGDTLWEIAAEVRPEGEDLRKVVYGIKIRNELRSSSLKAGQTLIISEPLSKRSR
jgi:cell division protein YceG involved in septum cleavage